MVLLLRNYNYLHSFLLKTNEILLSINLYILVYNPFLFTSQSSVNEKSYK